MNVSECPTIVQKERKGIAAMRKLHYFWTFPVALLIRLISPLVLVKTVGIRSGYIGHFISESSEQIHLKESRRQMRRYGRQNTLRLYYFRTTPTINSFLELKVRERLRITQFAKFLAEAQDKLPNSDRYKGISTANAGRFLGKINGDLKGKFIYSPDENENARNWLRGIGWKDGQPIICLLVRDSAFYNYGEFSKDSSWKFTEYRDSNIENYIPGIEFLLSKNFFVLRMGQIMNQPLSVSNTAFFDYAFSSQKSPFMDVWLFSNCQGIISTGTGPDLLGPINEIPMLMLNALPLYGIWSFAKALWFPKHLTHKFSGEKLTLREHLDSAFSKMEEYTESDVEIEELTSSQIEEACIEYFEIFFMNPGQIVNRSEKQKAFWEIFKNDSRFSIDHCTVHPQSILGESWLKLQNQNFLE